MKDLCAHAKQSRADQLELSISATEVHKCPEDVEGVGEHIFLHGHTRSVGRPSSMIRAQGIRARTS